MDSKLVWLEMKDRKQGDPQPLYFESARVLLALEAKSGHIGFTVSQINEKRPGKGGPEKLNRTSSHLNSLRERGLVVAKKKFVVGPTRGMEVWVYSSAPALRELLAVKPENPPPSGKASVVEKKALVGLEDLLPQYEEQLKELNIKLASIDEERSAVLQSIEKISAFIESTRALLA